MVATCWKCCFRIKLQPNSATSDDSNARAPMPLGRARPQRSEALQRAREVGECLYPSLR